MVVAVRYGLAEVVDGGCEDGFTLVFILDVLVVLVGVVGIVDCAEHCPCV